MKKKKKEGCITSSIITGKKELFMEKEISVQMWDTSKKI
jgi:hypothetical protein